jgi:hypothetical protein
MTGYSQIKNGDLKVTALWIESERRLLQAGRL